MGNNSRTRTTRGGGGSLVKSLIIAAVSMTVLLVVFVNGHGYLMDPPMRSTAWRYGFGTPINYDDNGLFCGGISVIHTFIVSY